LLSFLFDKIWICLWFLQFMILFVVFLNVATIICVRFFWFCYMKQTLWSKKLHHNIEQSRGCKCFAWFKMLIFWLVFIKTGWSLLFLENFFFTYFGIWKIIGFYCSQWSFFHPLINSSHMVLTAWLLHLNVVYGRLFSLYYFKKFIVICSDMRGW